MQMSPEVLEKDIYLLRKDKNFKKSKGMPSDIHLQEDAEEDVKKYKAEAINDDIKDLGPSSFSINQATFALSEESRTILIQNLRQREEATTSKLKDAIPGIITRYRDKYEVGLSGLKNE